MKTSFYFWVGFLLCASATCFAQVDIYQSDAYSVEEMCAREAEQEQNENLDYNDAYDSCIAKNESRDMYQSDREARSYVDAGEAAEEQYEEQLSEESIQETE